MFSTRWIKPLICNLYLSPHGHTFLPEVPCWWQCINIPVNITISLRISSFLKILRRKYFLICISYLISFWQYWIRTLGSLAFNKLFISGQHVYYLWTIISELRICCVYTSNSLCMLKKANTRGPWSLRASYLSSRLHGNRFLYTHFYFSIYSSSII